MERGISTSRPDHLLPLLINNENYLKRLKKSKIQTEISYISHFQQIL